MRGGSAGALLVVVALSACASSRRRADWAAPPQAVQAVYEAPSRRCWLQVGDVRLPTTRHAINKRSLAGALPRRQVRVMVYADPAVPTSCPGAVINKLRDAGYTPIGYASKPA